MFVRISMWKHLTLEVCFGKFNFNASKWSVQIFYFFFLILSWKTVYFRNLSISSRLSCLLAHNYANYDCISIILVITFTLKFIILFIWTFSFFLDADGSFMGFLALKLKWGVSLPVTSAAGGKQNKEQFWSKCFWPWEMLGDLMQVKGRGYPV